MYNSKLKNDVMSYYNEAVVIRYARKNELDTEIAQKHFRSMLAFLYLCGTSDEVFSPSEVVDEVWHTFLLFTKNYDDFCQNYFGKKIHHNPDIIISAASKEKNNNQYANMYAKAEKEFGQKALDFFPNPQLVTACGDCGHGGSCGGSTSCDG